MSHKDFNLKGLVLFVILVSSGLWLYGTFSELNSLTLWTTLEELGRLSGMAGSALLLIQMFLISRFPYIEQNVSKDKIVEMHKKAGFWSFWLIISHIILLVIGYQGSFNGLWENFLNMIFSMDGVLLATLGTFLIILVVGLSISFSRSKLNYESWHLIHLYGYVGVFIALPHQLWTGRDFVGNIYSTIFWWGIWGLVVFSILIFRIIIPIYMNSIVKMSIYSIKDLGENLFEMSIKASNMEKLNIRPGQFFNLRFLHSEGFTRANPFSVSKIYKNGLQIIFKVVGEGTRRMSKLPKNTKIFFEGPYGNLYRNIEKNVPMAFVGAGTGVTPLFSIVESLPKTKDLYFIQRTSNENDPLIIKTENLFNRNKLSKFQVIHGSRSEKNPWNSNIFEENKFSISDFVHLEKDTRFYICGQRKWVENLVRHLKEIGVNPALIHYESFGW